MVFGYVSSHFIVSWQQNVPLYYTEKVNGLARPSFGWNTCPALCLLWFLFIDKSLYCLVSDPFYCSHYNWVIIRSNWQKLSHFLIITVLILSKFIHGFYNQEKLQLLNNFLTTKRKKNLVGISKCKKTLLILPLSKHILLSCMYIQTIGSNQRKM